MIETLVLDYSGEKRVWRSSGDFPLSHVKVIRSYLCHCGIKDGPHEGHGE